MVALGLDESEFSSVDDPEARSERPLFSSQPGIAACLARAIRRVALPLFLLPLTRIFAHVRAEGLENLEGLEPPVIFAPTHQSYLDAARHSRRACRQSGATASRRPCPRSSSVSISTAEASPTRLNYYLSALFFNAFPIPQREAGALETMRYMGELAAEGYCVLIFPEGRMTDTGEIAPFQPGIGMLGAKLGLPVVPVRLTGLDRVLHRTWRMARPGPVTIRFGAPLHLQGEDYRTLAQQVEQAVRRMA